jgi:ABC-type glycerol-3-phosphate transport system permease component
MGEIMKARVWKRANLLFHAVLILLTFFPFYFLLISSVKSNKQILEQYFLPVLPFHFENYVKAFEKVIFYLGNSIFVCTTTAVGVAIISCISAYIFARFEFPGKNALFTILLAFMMIPGVLTLIPSFVLIARMKLINTHWGLILPYIAFGQITFVFILRSFIERIPKDLFEAARIDGASHAKVFRHIVMPLAKPILISLMLMNFLANWNDFIWPLLVVPKEKMKTVTVGLYAFTDVQQVQYGLMFAGFVIASIPLIILFSINMNYFIKGVTAGAIKA